MANTIKIKRGLSSNINNVTLAQGELAITTDTDELYVGKMNGKEKINMSIKVVTYDLTDPIIIIENDTEYRFTNRLDGLGIGTNPDLAINERLEALVTFQTSVTNFEFSNANEIMPGSPKILFIGDDTANFTFSPKANTTYEILFRWNGQFVSGQVKKINW